MKGILLAGGLGTRLHPMTAVLSKQLLPVYDKPMVHYPLSTLMLAGVRDILLISTPADVPLYRRLLGDGRDLGLRLSYAEQAEPRGIADAFLIGRGHIGRDRVALVLGDNVYYGHDLRGLLHQAASQATGGTVFGYHVKDPQRYGVAEFDATGKVVGIEEKPARPKSNIAITGLYFYDHRVGDVAAGLKPSARGELEITDVNRWYLERGELQMVLLGRGYAWLDTGTPQSLLDAGHFIAALEHRQGLKIACLEEVAYRVGFIDRDQCQQLAKRSPNPEYRDYLLRMLADDAAGRGG